MIYFIGSESGHVKIGYTYSNVFTRLASLQTGCPFELKLIKTIGGNSIHETSLHKKFKRFHLRGEWFHLSPEIQSFIDSIPVLDKPPKLPSALPPILTLSSAPPKKKAAVIKKTLCGLYEYLFFKDPPPPNMLLLKRVLASIDPRESSVVKMRFGIDCAPKTLASIGVLLKLTRERIRQIEAKALRRLKHPTRVKQLIAIDEEM